MCVYIYIYAYYTERSIKAHIIQNGGRLLTEGPAGHVLTALSSLCCFVFIGKRSLQISLQTNEEAGRIHLGNDPGGIPHLRHVILGGEMRMLLAGTHLRDLGVSFSN